MQRPTRLARDRVIRAHPEDAEDDIIAGRTDYGGFPLDVESPPAIVWVCARSQVSLDFSLPGRRDGRVRDEQRDDACWDEEHWPTEFARPLAIGELQAREEREAITCCI